MRADTSRSSPLSAGRGTARTRTFRKPRRSRVRNSLRESNSTDPNGRSTTLPFQKTESRSRNSRNDPTDSRLPSGTDGRRSEKKAWNSAWKNNLHKKIPRGSRGIFCATIFVRRALPFTRRRIGTRRGPLRLSLTRRTRISRTIPTLCLTKRPETPLRQQRRTRKPRRNRAYAPPASEGIRGSRR